MKLSIATIGLGLMLLPLVPADAEEIVFETLNIGLKQGGSTYQKTIDLTTQSPYSLVDALMEPVNEVPGMVEWQSGTGQVFNPSQWVKDGKPVGTDIPVVNDGGSPQARAQIRYLLETLSGNPATPEDGLIKAVHYNIVDPDAVPNGAFISVGVESGDTDMPVTQTLLGKEPGGEWVFGPFRSTLSLPIGNIADYQRGIIMMNKPLGNCTTVTYTLTSKSNPNSPDIVWTDVNRCFDGTSMSDPFAVSVSVPEPVTIGLLGLGSAFVALWGRRGRRG